MRLLRLVAILASTVAAALALSSGRAVANHVSCGDTITTDTTLDTDLIDCPNNGIVIGADDITLDLNGHRIVGNGTVSPGCDPEVEFCDVGLANDGHGGVTVRHGSVRRFEIGAFVFGARHNRLVRIHSSRNSQFGFVLSATTRSVVRNSSGNANPAPDGDGLGVFFGSRGVRILQSSFEQNAQLGIHVVDSTKTLIRRNQFSRNADFGIILEGDRHQIQGNHFIANGEALVGVGDRNVITENRVRGGGSGFAVERGTGNLVSRNVVISTGGEGIQLGLSNPPIGGSHNTVRGNVVRGSGDDAFRVHAKDDHSLVSGNIARRSGDDGFDIDSASTKLARNLAWRNADLGIEAVSGIIGGGNRAHGNGDPRQCTGIVCS